MSTSENHKRGRPTRAGQVSLQKKLRPYFEQGMTATFTANVTRINVKTVCRYFNEWTEEITKFEEHEFMKRQINERIRNVLSYDVLINEQYDLLNEIRLEINKYKKKNDKVPIYFWQTRIAILKAISTGIEKRALYAAKYNRLY